MPAGRSLGANPQRNLVETKNRLTKLAEICEAFFATSNFREFFNKAEPLEGEVVHRFVQDLAKTLNRPEVPSKKQGANEPDFIDLRKDLPAPRWTEGLEHVAWVANADQLFPRKVWKAETGNDGTEPEVQVLREIWLTLN